MTLRPLLLAFAMAAAPLAAAPEHGPLQLIHTTSLPGFEGDFDHFAVDIKGDQLFVSAEKHHSIEIFNLQGEHIGSITDVTTPHTLAFDVQKNNLLVADGGDSSVKFFDGKNHHLIKRVAVAAGPDAGVYDPEKRIFYVGNGGKNAHQDRSYISLISAENMAETDKIQVPANNLEAMAINHKAHLLYVNMRDKAQVGVVNLQTKTFEKAWTIPGLNRNTPLRFDEKNNRIFVAGRKPGKLFVINSSNGQLVATLDCVDVADDMTFDAAHHRILVTGVGGVSVFRQEDPDRYKLVTQFDTQHGKTSEYVASLNRFYIIHTKTDEGIAGLQVYNVS